MNLTIYKANTVSQWDTYITGFYYKIGIHKIGIHRSVILIPSAHPWDEPSIFHTYWLDEVI